MTMNRLNLQENSDFSTSISVKKSSTFVEKVHRNLRSGWKEKLLVAALGVANFSLVPDRVTPPHVEGVPFAEQFAPDYAVSGWIDSSAAAEIGSPYFAEGSEGVGCVTCHLTTVADFGSLPGIELNELTNQLEQLQGDHQDPGAMISGWLGESWAQGPTIYTMLQTGVEPSELLLEEYLRNREDDGCFPSVISGRPGPVAIFGRWVYPNMIADLSQNEDLRTLDTCEPSPLELLEYSRLNPKNKELANIALTESAPRVNADGGYSFVSLLGAADSNYELPADLIANTLVRIARCNAGLVDQDLLEADLPEYTKSTKEEFLSYYNHSVQSSLADCLKNL
jgi:hypothetical protein